VAKRLLADPLKFRDRTLARFVDADRATLTRGDRTVTFAKQDGTWKVTEPLSADAEQSDLEEFANALARLRADELVEEKPNDVRLADYGLDKPELRWRLFSGDKEVLNLAVGRKDKDGKRAFARLDKGELVVLLDPKLTDRAFAEYRKRAAWAGLDAAQVEGVAVSGEGGTFALRKGPAGWFDPQKPEDKINTEAVNELLDTLAGLKAERFAADKGADLKLYGLEPPQRVVVVTTRDGQSKTLHLGREEGGSGGKRVYARVPDPARQEVLVLGEKDTARLMRDRAAYVGKK
jgi:hypothetical protein